MATKSLFRQTLDEIPAETHIFIQKYTDILDRVQAILDRKGMKRRDLAHALGKSESEISKWLAGEHNFTLKSLAKLEAVLGEEILVVATEGSANFSAMTATLDKTGSGSDLSKIAKTASI